MLQHQFQQIVVLEHGILMRFWLNQNEICTKPCCKKKNWCSFLLQPQDFSKRNFSDVQDSLKGIKFHRMVHCKGPGQGNCE